MFQEPHEVEQFRTSRKRWPWLLLLIFGFAFATAGAVIWNRPDVDPPEVAAPLPEEDRQFLWDAEHHGLELATYGWKPFVSALAASDISRVSDAMADDFVGRVAEQWSGTGIDTASLVAAKQIAAGPLRERDREGFVDWLRKVRKTFAETPQARFKLTEIRPADPKQLDGDWLGSGRITLEGAAEAGGPAFVTLWTSFRTVRPAEESLGSQWLLECSIDRSNRGNSDAFLMREVAVERGLEVDRLHDNWTSPRKPVNTGGIYCCDYNRDGCVDLLVTDVYDHQGLILYRGTPDGNFENVSAEIELPSLGSAIDAIFADLNGDGWEDLVVPGKLVLENRQGERFIDVTGQSNLDDLIYHRGLESGIDAISGVSVVDYDLDGRVDLYVTRADVSAYDTGSWVDGSSGDQIGNQLLRNLGEWTFRDQTDQLNADGDGRSAFASVWLDANNDSYPDVYVIHEFGPGVLLVNRKAQYFEPVEVAARSSDFGSMGLSCGDVDNDGLIDLYVSNMYSSAGNRVMDNLPEGFYDDEVMRKLRRMVVGNQLHRNLGDLEFDSVADDWGIQQVGWGWGPAIADLNNDGWLDIYATCGFMSRDRRKPDG